MKIFLTGDPHSGKSTLINKILEHVDYKIGFVTNEILKDDQRIGFELEASNGKKVTFAHVNYVSDVHVSKYAVKLDLLDEFIESLPRIDKQSVLYIDEVGQMQLFSNSFRKLVSEYMSSPNSFIGTFSKVYDDTLIQKFKSDPSIEVIEVTQDNRDSLEDKICSKLVQ